MSSILSQLQIAALLSTILTLTAVLSGGAEGAGARSQLVRIRDDR